MVRSQSLVLFTSYSLKLPTGSIVPRVLPTLQTVMTTHRKRREKRFAIHSGPVLEFYRGHLLGLCGPIPGWPTLIREAHAIEAFCMLSMSGL